MSVRVEPYFSDEFATIYLADNKQLDFLEDVATFVVSDPPYGIGYVKGHGGRMVTNRSRGASRNIEPVIGDDRPFEPFRWARFEYCMMWGFDHWFRSVQPTADEHLLIWDKLDGVEPFDSFADVELAWCNWRGKNAVLRVLWKGVLQGDKANNGRRWHPTQKPELLMRMCIEHGPADAVIIDPFMGSGTTLVAAKQLGRRAIGVEIDERYCAVAAERLSAIRTPSLFTEAAP